VESCEDPAMPRIVSLIASATEIVDALGQLDHLVGRSHECDYPERVKALPVCTRPRIDVKCGQPRDRPRREGIGAGLPFPSTTFWDDVLRPLEPTHILTQIQCDVCAVSLRDVELAFSRGMKGSPRIVSLQAGFARTDLGRCAPRGAGARHARPRRGGSAWASAPHEAPGASRGNALRRASHASSGLSR